MRLVENAICIPKTILRSFQQAPDTQRISSGSKYVPLGHAKCTGVPLSHSMKPLQLVGSGKVRPDDCPLQMLSKKINIFKTILRNITDTESYFLR